MEEDTEYKKLPVEERCVHKLWKARVDGYEEANKIFREIDDEKSMEWSKFTGLIKKFVVDSNAMAQEKGLEATLVFVENCGHAGKTVGEVISGIVAKCIAAPKTKTRELSVQIAMMYIEIEKPDLVIEELVKGMEHKNPKIVAACVSVVTLSLREFGSKVVAVKPIIKKIGSLLTDRDKTVREEGKLLAIEIFRWIGPALKPQLASLAPVLITELEGEFDKLKGGHPTPIRFLKSQQQRQVAVAAAAADDDCEGDGNDDEVDFEPIDPMDLIDPVDILSKLPKDFYEKLEAKKWQERKESLEALDTLLKNPKLESGDYGELVRALKKVVSKDSNVVLVAMAGKSIAAIAKGLGKKFQPYAGICVSAIFEKFKEKKTNVVTALRDAIDSMYPSTNLEQIQEDILEALNNKNPAVKAETASFLARAFSKTLPTVLTKKLLKSYVTALLKTLNEPDPNVRDCAADAIGTLMKLVTEKVIGPFLTDVDALKMQKIKESCDKAVIHVKIPNPKKERPATVPTKKLIQKAGSVDAKPVQRPATSNVKKTLIKKQASQGPLAKSASSVKVLPTEMNLTPEEVDEQGSEIISSEILAGLADANWKTRLSSVESFSGVVNDLEPKCGHSQILVRLLIKKPGLKDTNFQVLKTKLEIIKTVVEKMGITVTAADYICNDVTEKLSDTKCSAGAAALLTSMAESISLEYMTTKVLEFAFDQQKSPKVQQEALLWVNGAIKEFGFHVNVKSLIEEAKKAVQMSNPTVRSAGVTLLGTMFLHMGATLSMFFDNEKPALKQQIQTEFDKYADQKPAAPIRSMKNKINSAGDDLNEENEDDEAPTINIADLLPRIDISPLITEALLAEIADKNWKVRNEGLVKLQGILSDSKLIKSTIGDLPQALSQRLIDSNAKIAQTSIAICQQLAGVMGPACKQHVRVIFPGLVHGLGDGKVFIRTASIQAINALGDQCGFKEFFESEMIADAMKNGSPVLRSELWTWIAIVLPEISPKSISKDELLSIMPHLYTNIIDRNADVRKNANDAVLGMMIHLGYDSMFKALDKQKPASKKDIQAALDKARPNLPVKPLPKNKQQAPIAAEEAKSVKVIPGQKRPVTAVKTTVKPKKEEDVDTSPILAINSTKNQRLIDEQKLRVLKWTFTQPREEFIDLLREQMNTANVNKGLTANMFHEDFRYHLKVIDSLIEDLPSNEKALICNLDLILKWLSLRFYDTNPSVLLKGLEYLNMVFQMLISSKYVLAENEGSCFIPHLLIKIGDPKDAVRNGVRSLLRQICFIYPFTKVFVYIMEGLKSKNARQRTECLDELGYLIETYGLTVCQPSAQSALKEIARHISDRDNSVRSAALNTIVQAYFLAGEKIYKLIGQMTEKDLSMLDERIKRSKKTRKPTVELLKPNVSGGSGSPPQDDKVDEQEIVEEELVPAEELSPVVTRAFEPPKVSGPFGLDPEIINDIEHNWIRSNQKKEIILPDIDVSCLHEPLRLSSVNGAIYPADRLAKLMTSHTLEHNHSFTTSPPQLNHVSSSGSPNLMESRPRLDPNILRIIRGIGSLDSITARAAMNELADIMDSPDRQAALRDYEELYIQSVLQQFKNLSIQPLSDAFTLYQPLLSSTFSFFDTRNLGKNLGIVPLKNIMSCLLGLMADQKLTNADNGQCTKVINSICLKILDRANFTYLNCALIRLLKETCSNTGLPKFTDLLMKCIWRNVKIMPERSNELEYGDILLEVHEFMVLLPTTWWQQRPSDTPLRTVKTIIHNMAKIKGTQILQHLNNIPIHSEIHSYLLKILKNFQKDGNLVGSSPQRPNLPAVRDHSHRLTSSSHETIAYIFKLIADPETAKEGISRLYDFKLKNPTIDINPSLVGTSPSFQKYIEDGLAKLEREGGDNKRTERSPIVGIRTTPNAKDPADFYLSKLNSLKLKGNLLPVNSDDAHSLMDNKITDENLNHNQLQTKFSLLKKELTPQISENRRELLQQKLAQMKLQK